MVKMKYLGNDETYVLDGNVQIWTKKQVAEIPEKIAKKLGPKWIKAGKKVKKDGSL